MRRLGWKVLRNIPLWLSLVCVIPAVVGAAPAGQTTLQNLLADGGFERGFDAWKSCGAARLVDARVPGMATRTHSGRYAAWLGRTSEQNCPEPPPGYAYLGRNAQVVWQSVAIPANAPGVTVSFWYWVDGTPQEDLAVLLGSNHYALTQPFVGATVGYVSPYLLPGWQLYRHVLRPDELAEVKGKTLLLAFVLDDAVDDKLTFLIDDVQVQAGSVRTESAPLPNALRGDGSRPIAYVHRDGLSGSEYYHRRLYRMNTDGTQPELVYRGQLSDVADPVWAPNGASIALIDGNTYPEGETNPDKYVSATALTVVNPDGGAPRVLHQTGGIPGEPDFIQELTELSWAPNGGSLAASIFAYNRYSDGRLEGGLARLELVNAQTGATTKLLDFATAPNWGRNNRILFEAYDLLGRDRDPSIWEVDVAAQPPHETHLLREGGFDEDNEPTWAPDGHHFVTIRPTGSTRYDADGTSHRNEALMLFDRQNLANPRMLLLGDHGFLSDPTWSPRGDYLLYTLSNDLHRDIWWLNVATGVTGPITTDHLSFDANWGPQSPRRFVYLPLVRR